MELTPATLSVALSAIGALCDGGWIDLRSGAGQTLATLGLAKRAFVVDGARAVAKQVLPDENAALSGRAEAFWLMNADRTRVIARGTVGTAKADLVLDNVDIKRHATVTLEAFQLDLA